MADTKIDRTSDIVSALSGIFSAILDDPDADKTRVPFGKDVASSALSAAGNELANFRDNVIRPQTFAGINIPTAPNVLDQGFSQFKLPGSGENLQMGFDPTAFSKVTRPFGQGNKNRFLLPPDNPGIENNDLLGGGGGGGGGGFTGGSGGGDTDVSGTKNPTLPGNQGGNIFGTNRPRPSKFEPADVAIFSDPQFWKNMKMGVYDRDNGDATKAVQWMASLGLSFEDMMRFAAGVASGAVTGNPIGVANAIVNFAGSRGETVRDPGLNFDPDTLEINPSTPGLEFTPQGNKAGREFDDQDIFGDTPGIGSPLGRNDGAPSFQTSPGMMRQVPGQPGQPVPIMAHGGEMVGRPPGPPQAGPPSPVPGQAPPQQPIQGHAPAGQVTPVGAPSMPENRLAALSLLGHLGGV